MINVRIVTALLILLIGCATDNQVLIGTSIALFLVLGLEQAAGVVRERGGR